MELEFFLKKFVTFFVEPLGMVLSLFVIGIYFVFTNKINFAKLFLGLSFGLLLLFSYQPFSNFLVKNLENQYLKYDYKQQVKYIHVLGSSHNTDNSQPISSNIGDSGTKRILEGVIIHFRTPGSKLIFTGFEGETEISNAKMNAKLAIALGVKEENIIINSKPKDTKEEAVFVKSIVGNEAFVLVTSATHMPRSIKLFKTLGLNPVAAPTDFHKDESAKFFTAPRITALKNSKMATHEYIGIIWSMLKK
ncbi:MAG: hypothetical protein C0628_04560 [Sulfurimonas sp.]|nr:MAG: hypothetical protein C0628_04560 [Sulfurimonas sp.]